MDSQCCSFLKPIVGILDEIPLSCREPRMTEGSMSNRGYVVDNNNMLVGSGIRTVHARPSSFRTKTLPWKVTRLFQVITVTV